MLITVSFDAGFWTGLFAGAAILAALEVIAAWGVAITLIRRSLPVQEGES